MVANEIAASNPDLGVLMRRHGVGAIVPFRNHDHMSAAWILLGDAFSKEVYTPRDFRMVENLFKRLAELFMRKLIFVRRRLSDAQHEARRLGQRSQDLEKAIAGLREDNAALQRVCLQFTEAHAEIAATIASTPIDDGAAARTLDDYVSEFEARLIRETLERCEGNKSMAARLLGLRPNTLHYKLERYGIAPPKRK
jgi:DNA-binding NtrC family response regulator